MRKFIVAVASLYDNDLKQFQIEAKSEKEAIAIGMTKSQTLNPMNSMKVSWVCPMILKQLRKSVSTRICWFPCSN